MRASCAASIVSNLPRISSYILLGLGVLVIMGWLWDIQFLKTIIPHGTAMVPATATCFALSSVVLGVCTNKEWKSKWRRNLCFYFPLVSVFFISGFRLLEYATGWDLQVEALFSKGNWIAPYKPGMSQGTALGFVLASASLLMAYHQKWDKTFQVFVHLGYCIAWLGIARYIFGGDPLLPLAKMAIHTSISLFILNVGIHCLRSDLGIVKLFVSECEGGMITRWLVPASLILPLIFGGLCLYGEKMGFYGPEAEIALFSLANMVAFGVLLWNCATQLQKKNSERRLTEEKVRKALNEVRDFKTALDEHAIVAITNPKGKIIYVNDKFCGISQYKKDELIGQDHRIINSRYHTKEFFKNLWGTIQAGEVWHGEICNRAKDGSYYWVDTTIVPFRNVDGEIYQYVAIRADITERKKSEQKLKDQLERLYLLQQITRGIAERQDLKSIFQVMVRSLEEYLPVDFCALGIYEEVHDTLTISSIGLRTGELGKLIDVTENKVIEIDQNGLSRCVKGQLVYESDIREVKYPFPKRLVQVGLNSLVLAPLVIGGKTFGVLIAARRATESFCSSECEFIRQLCEHTALAAHQAQLYGELQQAYNDLRIAQQTAMEQERLRVLGQMASGIAHDINNAITPISLYSEFMLESESEISPEAKNYLKVIQRSIRDVASTISRMREFYRKRQPDLELGLVNMNSLIQQAIEVTQARWNDMAQMKGVVIDVKVDLEPHLPEILASESEIREVLINLIFNAVDAMPEGGKITLRTWTYEGKVEMSDKEHLHCLCVEIEDTGVGMDEQTRQRCMEPFFTTKGERGTGLGLAMVYGILKRHGAQLEIDSEKNRGTAMRLRFPIPLDTGKVATEQPKVSMVCPSLRILLVDDDPVLLRALHDILVTEGHKVTSANGGQEGIDMFKTYLKTDLPIELVITDLGMPYVDGRKVAHEIKALSSQTPVILLTGWGQRLTAEGDIPEGVSCVLNKPPRLNELREAFIGCMQEHHAS